MKTSFVTRFLSRFSTALIAAMLLAPGGRARAAMEIISLDFQPNAPFAGRSSVDFTGVESQAASADSVFDASNIWNYPSIAPVSTVTVNPSFSNFVDSTGAPTTVGLSFAGTLTAANDTPINNAGSDGLENDYFLINAAGASSSATYTISGLPADTSVTMFLYGPNFGSTHSGSRGYTLTANGTPVTVTSTNASNNTALVTVTSDGSGVISGTWNNSGAEGDWSGMQLAYDVPEPGSAALLGLGLPALLGALRPRCRAA